MKHNCSTCANSMSSAFGSKRLVCTSFDARALTDAIQFMEIETHQKFPFVPDDAWCEEYKSGEGKG